MAFKMRKRLMGLHIEVSDSNSKSPALKRPVGEHPPTHKDSPVKTVWLIRHGESEHNTTSDWGIRDPGLTAKGWKQAKALKNEPLLKGALGHHDPSEMAELIVVSPLRRTLQTCQAVYEIVRSLNAAKSQKVPIIALSDLQETSDSPCDTGHPAHLLEAEFPEVDFSNVAEDWFDKQAKWNYATADRMTRFCEWLAARPEQRIVCVGHLDFFRQLLNVRLRNCGVAKYELSSEGWKQRAVAEVQKSVVQQWIHEMRASSDEDAKYSASKLIAETKNVFTTPKDFVLPSSVRRTEEDPAQPSWLAQASAIQRAPAQEQQGDKPEHVAQMLFLEILRRAGAGDKGAIDRKDLLGTMKDMGFEISLVQRLVSQICNASRACKSVEELNMVALDDFVSTVCLEHFWKVRDLASRKRAIWRSENDEPMPVSAPTHSRYSAYRGAYAYLSTPGVGDRGPSSDGLGLRETAFDRLKTPKSVALTHPKDPSLHLRAWQDGDGTGEEGAVRRPLSALSVGRPASALSLTHFSAAAPTSASDKDAVRTRSTSTLGTATPMLSKRLGITHSSLFLDENTSEGGGKETAAQKKPSRQAQRLKDALRVDVSTPGTAYYASPDRMLLSTAKTTEVTSPMQWGQVTSPTYKLPRQTSSRQVSINLEDSPTRSAVRPPTNTGPRSTRPKSAMRFLASDQERKSEDATEYLSKCEDYIGGMSAFVSNIEGALKTVQRDSIVRKEAVRSEVRRLMQELDRERNTTRKLSLTVDQKNQKIHELTQALKTEQELNQNMSRSKSLYSVRSRMPITRQ